MLRNAIAKKISLIGLIAFLASVATPMPSVASVKGRRNTAIGLSALSLYQLARGHGKTGLIVGAGAAYAWKRTSDSKKYHKKSYLNRSKRR